MAKCAIITGGEHSDARGTVSFVNGFDMSGVKRFYTITNSGTDVIRGWQGHQTEKKWFFCIKGSFSIRVVEVDNWAIPDKDVQINSYQLESGKPAILHVDGGCATAIQALEEDAMLIVFSDTDLSNSKADDFRFDLDYWTL